VTDKPEWYRTTLKYLVRLCRDISGKYQRSRVRSFLADDLAGVIEELLEDQENIEDKSEYYQSMIETTIATGSIDSILIALAELIQRLAIARLHVLVTFLIAARRADQIMDTLLHHHSVDLLWGNHDHAVDGRGGRQ